MTSPKPSRSSSTVRKMTPSPAEELRGCCCEAAPTIHYLHTTRRTRYTWRFEHERMTFQWSDGVRIADTSIFCDARRCPPSATAFVSHARAPRLRGGAECRVITTERTRVLRA